MNEARDEALRRGGVRIPDPFHPYDPRRRVTVRIRRYGFFWGLRCEDVEDDLFRAKRGCVPAFYGLITPWCAVGVLLSKKDRCLTE